jgi:heptosyltransferase-2
MFDTVDAVTEWRGDKYFRDTVRTLRNSKYDLIVDLHNNLRSSRVTTAVPSRSVKAGKDWFQRFAAVHLKKLNSKPRSAIARYADALENLKISTQLSPPALTVPDSARTWWRAERGKLELPEHYYVFAACARYPTKQAPATLWHDIAAELAARNSGAFVIVGTPAELESLSRIAGSIAGTIENAPVVVLAQPDITHTAAIVESAQAVVSNDTGPAHLSAALGVPTVALFGPTHPVLGFEPLGNRAAAYTVDVFCSPCSLHGERTCYRDRRYCFLDMNAVEIVNLLDELSSR